MRKIKKILIIVFLIIIILMMCIYMLLRKQQKTEENEIESSENYGGDIEPVKYDNGFLECSDFRIFFSIQNAIEKYEKICKFNIKTDYTDTNIYINEDEYLLNIKNELQRKQAIYDLLDKEYIAKQNITVDNLSKFMFDVDTNTILVPKRLIYKYGTNINTYIYEIYLIKNKNVENKAFILRVNNKNATFSMEFVNDVFDDISSLNVDINDNYIENTGYNKFAIKNVNAEQVAKAHMDYYKYLVMAKPSIIYNDYLSDEYKNKRYGSLKEFEKYINKNIEEIRKCQVTKYMSESIEGGKIQYVCVDQYENYYIFDEDSAMQYKVKFDNYTIITDNFKEKYEKAKDEKKVQMNVDRFIQMINRHDYKTSYDCISSGFKNNYLNTQEKFENYIKSIFFEYNKFEFKNLEQKGSNLYVCNLEITDLTGESSEMNNITIIMELNDELNFEMSFGI